MPKMTNAKSAPVLDSADAVLNNLNWVLFKQEQDARLWSDPDSADWYPGDEIWDYPVRYLRPFADASGYLDSFDGNAVRPMAELHDDLEFHSQGISHTFIEENGEIREYINSSGSMSVMSPIYIRCEECETNWIGDDPCFVCGVEREPFKARMTKSDPVYGPCTCEFCQLAYDSIEPDLMAYSRADVQLVQRMMEPIRTEFIEEMVRATRVAARSMRRTGRTFRQQVAEALIGSGNFRPNDLRRFVGLAPLTQRLIGVDFGGDSNVIVILDEARDLRLGLSDGGLRFFQHNRQPRAVWDDRITMHHRFETDTMTITTPELGLGEDYWFRETRYPTSTPEWARRRPRYES